MTPLNEFRNLMSLSFTNSPSLFEILLSFIFSILFSVIITITYQKNHNENDYQNTFLHSLFIFSLVTAFITLIIGNNIARAFGLIGALSLIRFRTAIKNTYDTVFLFWALAAGTACGAGFYISGLVFSIALALIITLLRKTQYGNKNQYQALLKITLPKGSENYIQEKLPTLLEENNLTYTFINYHFSNSNDFKRYHYSINALSEKSLDNLESILNSEKTIHEYELYNHEAISFI